MRNYLRNVKRFSDEQSKQLGERFIRHEKDIERTVRYYISRYGGDYESLHARAVDKLCTSFLQHDESKQTWEKYFAVQLRYGLLDDGVEKKRKRTKVNTNVEEAFLEVTDKNTYDYSNFQLEALQDVMSSLTQDAQYVLDFILTKSCAVTLNGYMRNLLKFMRQMGWSRRRTITAMKELKHIITTEI